MIQPMSVEKSTRSSGAEVGLVRGLAHDRQQEAALHVQRALRPARRSRGVCEEVRALRSRRPRARARSAGPRPRPPTTSRVRGHRAVDARAAPDEDLLDARRVRERLVEHLLHRDEPAAPVRRVRGEHELRAGVGDPRARQRDRRSPRRSGPAPLRRARTRARRSRPRAPSVGTWRPRRPRRSRAGASPPRAGAPPARALPT